MWLSTLKPKRLLFHYIVVEILPLFFWGAAIFAGIMLMLQAIRLADFLILKQASLIDVGILTASMLVSFMAIAIPIAFLFAVMMGISRLNSEGEILALQTSGSSINQIFYPLGILAAIVSLFLLLICFYVAPKGNRVFELWVEKIGSEKVMASLKPGVFNRGFYGLVLFADQIDPTTLEMQRVFLYDPREADRPLAIFAKRGVLSRVSGQRTTFRLMDGEIYIEKPGDSLVQQFVKFQTYDVNLQDGKSMFSGRNRSLPSHTYSQLVSEMNDATKDPYWKKSLSVEFHRRITMSFSAIVFAVFGFWVALKSRRGMRSAAILLCLGMGVLYWLSYMLANGSVLKSDWPVGLVLWLPNIIFLAIPAIFWRGYKWH